MSILSNKYLFPIFLEAWKSKIKMPADSVSSEGSLPGSARHFISKSFWKRKISDRFLFFQVYQALIGAPLSWPHLNLTTFQRSYLQIPSHWGLGFNIWLLRGCYHSVHSIQKNYRILNSHWNPYTINKIIAITKS